MDDTGCNVRESYETLLIQQARMLMGKRPAQMFPKGTPELPLPKGFERFENTRGVYHFNPAVLSERIVKEISRQGKENLILELGPFDKSEIEDRILHGEFLVGITEFTPEKIEVRSAIGTTMTAPLQMLYFERTKGIGHTVIVGPLPLRVMEKANGV